MIRTEELDQVTHPHLHQACNELDRRLRAGERCAAEEFFARFPLLACEEDSALELVYTEFVTREELKQRPTPEEYYARFPYWKERLERQFQVHDLLREAPEGVLPTEDALPVVSGPHGEPYHLGRYELRELISSGGCGVVYKAWQQGLDRLVALKVLLASFRHHPRARQRFCHEARVMASLRHPHLMPVHEVGECQGVLYFSMDLVAGGSLARRIQGWDGMPGFATVATVDLLATVARAIEYAHQRGVIHCDLKPSNILLDEEMGPLVSDFGLASLTADPATADDPGAIVGTPAYMAPEQLREGPAVVTPATDIWALGVILFEMLAGRRPFEGPSLVELERQVCAGAAPSLCEATRAVDRRLAAICARCLHREPRRRYSSAAALASDLEEWKSRQP